MKKIAFAGVAMAALIAIPALALARQGGDRQGRLDQPLTRAEVQGKIQAKFAEVDADRDGFVTREEARARAEAAHAGRREARGERRAAMFDRLDADKDGFISRDELPGPGGRPGVGRPAPDAAPASKPQGDSKDEPKS